MGILDDIGNPQIWEAYYLHKVQDSHLLPREAAQLRTYIDTKAYVVFAAHLRDSNYCFEPPCKREINKLGTSKKRVVYTYSYNETQILKLISYLLYRYDATHLPNCYSFRRHIGAKQAIRHLTGVPSIDDYYCYKIDIKNYFNSINIDLLLPMLKQLFSADKPFYSFIERLLQADCARYNGELIHEKRGVMAGTPISPFLANVYLKEVDQHFYTLKIPYARYSDDIILFARTHKELNEYRCYLDRVFLRLSLQKNLKKESLVMPGNSWEFLGIEYCKRHIDVSLATKRKLMGKVRRKARSIRRWALRKEATPQKAMEVFARVMNRKLLENQRAGEFTWARWFFPLLTTSQGLKQIDAYIQENMRYCATGVHNHANYRIRYESLKLHGYKSLVNEYYRYRSCVDTSQSFGYAGTPNEGQSVLCTIEESAKEIDLSKKHTKGATVANELWDQLAVLKSKKWVDLTHPLDNDSPYWDGIPRGTVELCKVVVDFPDIMDLCIQSFKFPGQFGTHIDYPGHFVHDGRLAGSFDVKDTVLPLVVIDVSKKAAENPDYELTIQDILDHEAQYGRIPEGSFVAMRTDWSKRWPDGAALSNIGEDGNEHFPGWTLETLDFVFHQRGVAANGHETLDTDAPITSCAVEDLQCERYVLQQDKFQIEMLANLDQVPATGALIFISAMRIPCANGLPVRAFAILP